MNKNTFLTGAGGFIGSHLTELLVERGYNVKAFVHYNSLNRWGWLECLEKNIQSRIEVVTGDICDPHGVKSAMKGCDTVFHLAALIGIPYSYRSPQSYVDTNVLGTLNVLQAAKENDVKKIIHTSTSEIYGTAQFVPITESHPVNPQSPYAATKASADFLALSFYRSFGLPVAVVRPFNTFGPRQSARAVIPSIIVQMLGGKKEIKLGSVAPTRDFTFVKDTANGFLLSALSKKNLGEITNLGTGCDISISELVWLIARLTGSKVKIITDKTRIRPEKSEVERLLADNSKAKELLGWTPKYTIEEGLRETIRFFKDNPGICKSEIYNV